MQTLAVDWTPVAETMREQLSREELAQLSASLAHASLHFEESPLRFVQGKTRDSEPFWVLDVTPQLLAFLSRRDDRLVILDVVRRSQLAWFVAADDGSAHNGAP